MTTFLLVRHGLNDSIGRYLSGWSPGLHLNQEGRAQAERLARALADVPLAAVYSSPLERTVETAEPIAARHGLPVVRREELGETRFGEWTGRPFEELDQDPAWHRFNRFRSGTRPPGGETMNEVQTRLVACILHLRNEHAGATLAVVGHADPIRAVLFYALGVPLDMVHRVEVSPASVTTVAWEEDSVRVLGVNIPCPDS